MSRAGLILLVIAAALLAALWLFDPFGSVEEVALPDELDYPAYFRAEAAGSIEWEDDGGLSIRVPGRMRASYVVFPDGRAAVTNLAVWVDDVEIEESLAWWPSEPRAFRCTTFSNTVSLVGSVEGDRITVPPGTVLAGRTYRERGPSGDCRGPSLSLEFATESEVIVRHDPANDGFGVETALTWAVDGTEVALRVETEGSFLNRPPVAVLSTARVEGATKEFTEGCPGIGKGQPPIAPADGPEGLRLTLRSSSYDPDGADLAMVGLKNPRFDLRLERWLHSDGGAFRHLGDGPSPGDVLFATGREHRLVLVAVDRSGSQNRAYCHFRVELEEGRS